MRYSTPLVMLALSVQFIFSCNTSTNKEKAVGDSKISGADLYAKKCASCHLGTGTGMESVYPPLVQSDYLKDKEKAIEMVLRGRSGEIEVNGKKYSNVMPPQSLSDEEIASVLSYVYTNMNNGGTTVSAEDVKTVREKSK